MARRILFVHQNFPGQFPHIADALRARGDKLAAIAGPTGKNRPGVDVRRWNLKRGTTKGIYDFAVRAEADLMRATVAAQVAEAFRKDGFKPDVIVGHPGWGETLLLGEIFPDTPQLLFGEFYYHSRGFDVNFDPEFEDWSLKSGMRVRAKNMGLAQAYAEADAIVCPTPFQASTMPRGLGDRIHVLHEGVDLGAARRKPDAVFTLPDGRVLDGSRPVITFINRSFERLRGFHVFMRALPEFLAAVPEAEVVIIGRDGGNVYGGALPNGETWKARMMAEVGDRLDMSRVHFTGPVAHADMISAMSISWAHVYLTYPFVLSWSLTEAMAAECLVIGSDTAPVRDAIVDGENGLLVDFFDRAALVQAMTRACREPEAFRGMRAEARRTALARFDRETVGVPGWLKLIDQVAEAR